MSEKQADEVKDSSTIFVDDDEDDDILVGPDLNASKPPLDKKLYRQVILKKNGLRVVLISDTLALGQKNLNGEYKERENVDDEISEEVEEETLEDEEESHRGDEEEEDEEETGEVGTDEEEEDEVEEDEKGRIRKAAVALVVGAGSFYDPPKAMGMAHFLEHMLFMGTKKYPTENAYDSFLCNNGGSSNAYTELEHTVFHFDIPHEYLFQAMDMFAQFFVDPLLMPDAVDRELNSIESEFQLVKNSDECRTIQLLFHTAGKGLEEHPFGTFSWGNKHSLKEIPEKHNIDTLAELRNFYDKYYYASNMSLVVIGAYSLDELQNSVVKHFADIPAEPRIPSPLAIKNTNSNPQCHRTWDNMTVRSPIKKCGMPFEQSSLGKIYRIIPIKDRHTLSVVWQLPPQQDNWRSKPCDYLGHLLGHEGQGSLLAAFQKKSWATACYAGMGSEGYEYASSHAIFTLTFTLSEEGVNHWHEIVHLVYTYIGMIRFFTNQPDGLPDYIYEELSAVNEVSYKYADEQSPAALVEELVDDLAPDRSLPPDKVLEGYSLLFSCDDNLIKDILDQYLIPTNARVDLLSTSFRSVSDNQLDGLDESIACQYVNALTFSPEKAGPPSIEPAFGTKYWCHIIPPEIMESWEKAASPFLPTDEFEINLPAINPFVPTEFSLKSLLSEDEYHSIPKDKQDSTTLESQKESFHLFPPIPPPSPESRLPILVADDEFLKLWWLQDRKFRRPVAELRMAIISKNSNRDPLHRACSDLLALLWKDAITEISYQASIAELGNSITVSDRGFTLRVHGFDHKLLQLANKILNVLFGFAGRGSSDGLPDTIKEGRFDACLEVIRRKYSNSGMQASSLSTNVRLQCLRDTTWSSWSKMKALEEIDVSSFVIIASSMLERISVEALFHGNCNRSDADIASNLIKEALNSRAILNLPKVHHPKQFLVKTPSTVEGELVVVPSKDQSDSNTAVEMYFQVGPDNINDRVLIDVLVQILDEPLYNQLRTRDQFGYYVSVNEKWTYGIMGLSFKVVTASKTGIEVQNRIETFLAEFREKIVNMSEDEFLENLIGLSKNKLEMYTSLEEESSDLWSEIVALRYDWECSRSEAVHLQTVKKQNVLDAYEKWLAPSCADGNPKSRRKLTVVVEGGTQGGELGTSVDIGRIINERIVQYHTDHVHDTWGEIEY